MVLVVHPVNFLLNSLVPAQVVTQVDYAIEILMNVPMVPLVVMELDALTLLEDIIVFVLKVTKGKIALSTLMIVQAVSVLILFFYHVTAVLFLFYFVILF